MAPSSRRHSSESSSEDEALRSDEERSRLSEKSSDSDSDHRSDEERSRSLSGKSSDSDSDQESRDEKHPNFWSSTAKTVRTRRVRRSRVSSRAEKRNKYDSDRKNVEKNGGEKSDKDKEEVRREGDRRNSDEEIEERKSRMEVSQKDGDDSPFVVEDPFVQQLVSAFYQCLNGCVGLVLKGNPISPSSLEELLRNSIRNVEIAGGNVLDVRALQCAAGDFMSAAEEWRSLRAACSAPLADQEAEAQREAARKALEALSEEVTQLQARADQISNAREAKSLAKETAENAILNALKIIAEQRPKVNLLEEEVAKLFQEQSHVELAIAEKEKAMAAAQARLVNSAALAEAESRQAREALQEQLAAREAAMKALLRQ